MITIGSILSALAAIPKIVNLVESFAAAVTLWYVGRAQQSALHAISDAAAEAARAKTDEDRYKAAESWRLALSKPRIKSGSM